MIVCSNTAGFKVATSAGEAFDEDMLARAAATLDA